MLLTAPSIRPAPQLPRFAELLAGRFLHREVTRPGDNPSQINPKPFNLLNQPDFFSIGELSALPPMNQTIRESCPSSESRYFHPSRALELAKRHPENDSSHPHPELSIVRSVEPPRAPAPVRVPSLLFLRVEGTHLGGRGYRYSQVVVTVDLRSREK